MAYSQEQIESSFDAILEHIEKGNSLRAALALDGSPSSRIFYQWIEADDTKVKRYARACEERADSMFEEILDIADESAYDMKVIEGGKEIVDNEVVQRSRLKIDARKWMLSKMNPKKYGESSLLKLANNDGNELKINAIFSTDILNVPTDISDNEDSKP